MRQIVLAVENSTATVLPDIAGKSQEEVGYHAHLLVESRLAEGFDMQDQLHRLPCDYISNLTVDGHEFADLARDDDRWRLAMDQDQSRGPVTLAILKHLLTNLPRQTGATAVSESAQDMIHVIAYDAVTFLRDGYGGEQMTLKPGGRPQLVPVWVRDTDAFRFATRDGSLLEVEIKTPPAAVAAEQAPQAPTAIATRAANPSVLKPRLQPHAKK